MKGKFLTVAGLAFALSSGWTLAQDADDGGDLTMTLLPEDAELPDAVTKILELPEGASEEGIAHGAQGLATANAAREDGRAFGEEMAASAQENRDNLVHGAPNLGDLLPDNIPDDHVPDLPELPETPAPAGRP